MLSIVLLVVQSDRSVFILGLFVVSEFIEFRIFLLSLRYFGLIFSDTFVAF